ncbi:MAG: beta-propeller domain-containing protein [Verrucomicrobiaceae bacterium]|nr:beta-propeller domain-containing protein [Verrucomicrobiaceae bacterium]
MKLPTFPSSAIKLFGSTALVLLSISQALAGSPTLGVPKSVPLSGTQPLGFNAGKPLTAQPIWRPQQLGQPVFGSGRSSSPSAITTTTPGSSQRLTNPRIIDFAKSRPLAPSELQGTWLYDRVIVSVPGGIYRVTLEKRQGNAWKPLQTKALDGTSTTLTFFFPTTERIDDLRVMGSNKRKFTPAQLTGVTQFDAESTASTITAGLGITLNNGGVVASGGSTLVLNGTSSVMANTAAITGSQTLGGTRAVDSTTTATTTINTGAAVEADIWKFSGDRLFYFNQLRGLQVFDMSDPAKPVKTGSIRMPAIGTQLQSLDDKGQRVVLFTRKSADDYSGHDVLRFVEVSAEGKPTVVKTVELDGYAGESRLIGDKLYVITTGWSGYYIGYSRLVSGNVWYWNTGWWRLHGYDLSDVSAPVALGYVSGQGTTPVLQASGGYLLVAGNGYGYTYSPSYQWRYWSYVSAVDFESNGKPHLVKSVETKQQVRDLFKMAVVNGAIVTVTQEPRRWEYNPDGWSRTDVTNADGTITTTQTYSYRIHPSKTWVETFSLDPAVTEPLAQLHLAAAQGEDLHATRFDGSRLYVVTFGVRQDGPQDFTHSYTWTWNPLARDPLFIVDLTDPANPVVRRELSIPGYSTYVEVDGDRLIAVGREERDVSVSLFDVSNPGAATQLARVYPSKTQSPNEYAWSEAEWEHRAVTYLRDQGKLIVPVQVWSSGQPSYSTQTVNVTRDSLTLGPVVKMKDQARRGTALKGYLVSISGKELAVHTDPPSGGESTEAAWLELAWPVEQVFQVGDYLVQIESNAPGFARSWWRWWGSTSSEQNVVRLTKASDPDEVLDSVALPNPNAGIVATTERNGTIFVAQHEAASSTTPAKLRTWMLRVQSGKLVKVGDGAAEIPDVRGAPLASDSDSSKGQLTLVNNGNWQLYLDMQDVKPVWVSEDKLVWFAPCRESFWWNSWWGWDGPNLIASPIRMTSGILLTSESVVNVPGTLVANTTSTSTATTTAAPPAQKTKTKREKLPVAVVFPVQVAANEVAAGSAVTVRRDDEDLPLNQMGEPFGEAGYLFFSSYQMEQWRYYPIVVLNDTSSNNEHDERVVNGERRHKTSVCNLHVLDFTHGIEPVVRDPVSIPGLVYGVSSVDANGAWLITDSLVEQRYGPLLKLRSLAYDGVEAHQVDAIGNREYSYGMAAKDGLLFSSGYEYGYNDRTGYWGRYVLKRFRQQQTTGMLEQLADISFNDGAYSTRPIFSNGCLLYSSYSSVSAWKINADATLTWLGENRSTSWGALRSSYIYDRFALSADLTGVWMPACDYGVEWLPFKLPATSSTAP